MLGYNIIDRSAIMEYNYTYYNTLFNRSHSNHGRLSCIVVLRAEATVVHYKSVHRTLSMAN